MIELTVINKNTKDIVETKEVHSLPEVSEFLSLQNNNPQVSVYCKIEDYLKAAFEIEDARERIFNQRLEIESLTNQL